MAKRSSINARSKVAENRVSKYLWGELRDWKELHDISGRDFNDNIWYGEVKNWAWARGPAKLYSILKNAYAQLENVKSGNLFVVFLPVHSSVEDAIVYRKDRGRFIMEFLNEFKDCIISGNLQEG